MISALTLLNLDECEGRYASYLDLSDQMRKFATHPLLDLQEQKVDINGAGLEELQLPPILSTPKACSYC